MTGSSTRLPRDVRERFRDLRALEGMLITPEDRVWLEKPPARPAPKPTVLYLGCNILRTPHLAQTIVALFEHIGEDFVALGGTAFCCGLPVQTTENRGQSWGERLTIQFGHFQPRQVVMWCPSCLYYHQEVLALATPYPVVHVTEFLAENKHRFSFSPLPPTRIALHYHCGSPAQDRQAAAVRSLLAAVPGIETREIGSLPTWGRNCAGNQRDRMGREAWDSLITPFFDKATALQADVFATAYHGCLRMYGGYEKGQPFSVEHYLSVVARALGITYPDKYKQYLHWKDEEAILQDASANMKASSVTASSASPVVKRIFVDDCGF